MIIRIVSGLEFLGPVSTGMSEESRLLFAFSCLNLLYSAGRETIPGRVIDVLQYLLGPWRSREPSAEEK